MRSVCTLVRCAVDSAEANGAIQIDCESSFLIRIVNIFGSAVSVRLSAFGGMQGRLSYLGRTHMQLTVDSLIRSCDLRFLFHKHTDRYCCSYQDSQRGWQGLVL